MHALLGHLQAPRDAAADFVPPPGAVWRTGTRAWRPVDIVGHNDAAPHNAVWEPAPGSAGSREQRGPSSSGTGSLGAFSYTASVAAVLKAVQARTEDAPDP